MSSPAPMTTDASLWPLFVIIPPPRITTASIEGLIDTVNGVYARRERFATLVDTTFVEQMPSASDRRLLTEWQTETIELIRRYNVCTATVVSHSLIRGAMTAMNWLFRPPNEQIALPTFSEGLEFCARRLREDGHTLPPLLESALSGPPPQSMADILGRTGT